MACGGDLGRREDAVMLVLASTSSQRRAILEQLRIPFAVAAPNYFEAELAAGDGDVVAVVRTHADGKATSVEGAGRLVLGVDTVVESAGRIFGKPAGREDARAMLDALGGRTHRVVSGLSLRGPGVAVVDHAVTLVTFRRLSQAVVSDYLDTGEWHGRAGAYAIQGVGARLVASIEGDYLNVVGLPAALLVALLERHSPEVLQING